MIRLFFSLFVILIPLSAQAAIEAPPGQERLGVGQVLRGNFAEERQIKITDNPIRTSGHFVAAMDHGLIWAMEKPLPTSTVVTPQGAMQDVGGFAMKLPVKNLAHLYAVISEAVAGDWNGLEPDFKITRAAQQGKWQMLLTPKDGNSLKKIYVAITVSGSRFAENIVMTKVDGTYDQISFSDMSVSSEPVTAQENRLYAQASR